MKALFETGQIVFTPGVMDLLSKPGTPDFRGLLMRHISGDWGDMDAEDKATNDYSVKNGERIFSAYETRFGKVWVITEYDRSVTTLLLPEEY